MSARGDQKASEPDHIVAEVVGGPCCGAVVSWEFGTSVGDVDNLAVKVKDARGVEHIRGVAMYLHNGWIELRDHAARKA